MHPDIAATEQAKELQRNVAAHRARNNWKTDSQQMLFPPHKKESIIKSIKSVIPGINSKSTKVAKVSPQVYFEQMFSRRIRVHRDLLFFHDTHRPQVGREKPSALNVQLLLHLSTPKGSLMD